MYTVTRPRDRTRVPALQQTDHACAAAAVTDALADLLGMESVRAAEELQADIIQRLGGLRTQGTTLAKTAAVVSALFGRAVEARVISAHLDQAVAAAVMGAGVVVHLANPGQQEGHAVRIEGGEGALRQSSGDPVIDRFLHANTEAISDRFPIFVFDPWHADGTENLSVQSIGVLRPRFDQGGRNMLLVTRKDGLGPIANAIGQQYAQLLPRAWVTAALHERRPLVAVEVDAYDRIVATCTTTGVQLPIQAHDDPATSARLLHRLSVRAR